MADNIKIGVHVDHQGQRIKNVGLDLKTTAERNALAGVDLYDGRIIRNTTTGHVEIYNLDLTAWEQQTKATDLLKFNIQVGTHSPVLGLPDGTTAGQIGSGVDDQGVALTTAASLQAGDYFIMSAAGLIPGIQGDDNLSVGDLLIATQDDPNAVVAQAQSETYTMTAMTVGDARVTINGTDYDQAFNTDVATTLADFVTAHAATILANNNVTVTSAAGVLSLASSIVGTAFTSAVGNGTGGDATWSAVTVVQANVELAWLGVNRNFNESALASIQVATLTAPLVAATPLSFAAAMASEGITNVISIQVVENATGEKIYISEDVTAQEVTSNATFASVTITIFGN